MANNHSTLTGLFTDIADAIREKTGGTETIIADNFPEVIAAIETCPDDALFLESETKTAALNVSRYWRQITYGNNKFVAVASNSAFVEHSTDGFTWNEAFISPVTQAYSVTYGNGKFVAAVSGSTATVIYSTDGITWTTSTNIPSSVKWVNLVYFGGNKFILLAPNYTNAAYSTDGIVWTEMTLPRSSSWKSIAYGNGKFVITASNTNNIIYSTDGITWETSTTATSANWYSVTYGNGKFVAISDSGVASYSTDGITWIETELPNVLDFRYITYGNGKFVAPAYNSDVVIYSTDGIIWETSTMPSSAKWNSVAYDGEKFVGIAFQYIPVAISYDGINWYTTVTKSAIVDVNDVDVTEETVQATGLLDPELATQDDLIAQIATALEGKVGASCNHPITEACTVTINFELGMADNITTLYYTSVDENGYAQMATAVLEDYGAVASFTCAVNSILCIKCAMNTADLIINGDEVIDYENYMGSK